jgi:hypothetical protein
MPRLTRAQRAANLERAERMRFVVTCYQSVGGIPGNPPSRVCDCDQSAVDDILADLMHYCQSRKLDFTEHLERARENYHLERLGLE